MSIITSNFPVLLVITPLIVAVCIPLLGRINKRIPPVAAVVSTAFTLMVSIILLSTALDSGPISYWLGNWAPPWGIEYVVDTLSGFVLVVVAFMALMVALYTPGTIRDEVPNDKETTFYSLYMLLVAGLLGIVITGDVFNMYVFIEISSLAGYALIASGKKREALTASFNYLILGTVGATFFIIGVGLLYMVTGTLNMADLASRLPEIYDSKVVLTAFAFFSVGLSLKLALFPLHIWLPKVYTNAPSAVSSLMAATGTKVAAYALIRITLSVFDVEFSRSVDFGSILLVLSCAAIIAGSVLAISQTNIKMMLAYSSVGQVGYIVLGLALLNETALTGSLIHILNHALMKGALFMVVGIIVFRTGVEEISGLRGLGRCMPFTMAAFTIASLSMIGVPLTVGFISKWYLAVGAVEAGMWYVVPVILVSSVLTAVYFWRIVEGIYFGKAANVTLKGPTGLLVPTMIVAALCVVFGVAASVPVSVARLAASALLGGGGM